MRKLYLHIGLPKTGSTSVQRMLHRLSPSLERVGVHVPASSSNNGQHLIVRQEWPGPEKVNRFNMQEVAFRALQEEVGRCAAPKLVVSHESLALPAVQAGVIPRFMDLARAADLDVEVIACVRPQSALLESLYVEHVRSMRDLPPVAEWLEENLRHPLMNFSNVVAPWKRAFGKVAVLPVERSRLPHGLLVRFLECLGVDDAAIVAAARRLPRLNARDGAKAVEIIRLLNIALRDIGLAIPQRQRALALVGNLSEAIDDDRPFAGLTLEQIDAIDSRFKRRNARFAREYGVDADGELFRDGPGDGFNRPTRASWRELSEGERSRVSGLVRRRLGVVLPDGPGAPDSPSSAMRNRSAGPDARRRASIRAMASALPSPQGRARRRAGEAAFEQVAARLSRPGFRHYARDIVRRGAYIARGLAQIRSRSAMFRWLRWQLFGLRAAVRQEIRYRKTRM